MKENQNSHWDGVDRRNSSNCRRSGVERRVNGERRCDRRGTTARRKRSLMAWVRTLTNPRLGVDRRKGGDQRSRYQRRDIKLKSLLTEEELSELLK